MTQIESLVAAKNGHAVFEDELTDGSKVYSVRTMQTDKMDVIHHCTSYDAAWALLVALDKYAIDTES